MPGLLAHTIDVAFPLCSARVFPFLPSLFAAIDLFNVSNFPILAQLHFDQW